MDDQPNLAARLSRKLTTACFEETEREFVSIKTTDKGVEVRLRKEVGGGGGICVSLTIEPFEDQ